MQTPIMQTFRWMRVPGDTVFFLGAVALVVFIAGLKTCHSFRRVAPLSRLRATGVAQPAKAVSKSD